MFVANTKTPDNTRWVSNDTAVSAFDCDPASTGNGLAITGASGAAKSLYADSAGSGADIAVYSKGNLTATGKKSTEIHHPLDLANGVLRHFCAEGPEPLNVYRGTVALGPDGTAWERLPDDFEAINRDLTHHFTCAGRYALVYVASEVRANRFKVAGGQPGLKVCEEVTGVRKDAYVRNHGFRTDQEEPADERGFYPSPDSHGLPRSRSTSVAHTARLYPDGRVVVGGREQPARP